MMGGYRFIPARLLRLVLSGLTKLEPAALIDVIGVAAHEYGGFLEVLLAEEKIDGERNREECDRREERAHQREIEKLELQRQIAVAKAKGRPAPVQP